MKIVGKGELKVADNNMGCVGDSRIMLHRMWRTDWKGENSKLMSLM